MKEDNNNQGNENQNEDGNNELENSEKNEGEKKELNNEKEKKEEIKEVKNVFGKEEGVIYFINSNNWPTVKFYVWKTEGQQVKTAGVWPGAEMNCTGKKYKGHNIYSAHCDGEYKNIIFSNGGSDKEKTQDLSIGESCWYSTEGPIGMPGNIIDSGQ